MLRNPEPVHVRTRLYTMVSGPGTFHYGCPYPNFQTSHPSTSAKAPSSDRRSEACPRSGLGLGTHGFGTSLHRPKILARAWIQLRGIHLMRESSISRRLLQQDCDWKSRDWFGFTWSDLIFSPLGIVRVLFPLPGVGNFLPGYQ